MDRAKPAEDADRADPDDALAHVKSHLVPGIERRADTGKLHVMLERPPGARDKALDALEFQFGGIFGTPVEISAVG